MMPRKVLISFLGTGRPVDRGYPKASYRFSNGTQIESSFIAYALKEYYAIDSLILVGTVKSIWEEVYSSFSGEAYDDKYHLELWEHCVAANANSPLFIPDKEKVEKTLGEGSKVVLIKYGLNNDEIRQNENTILCLEEFLNKDDELYVDITHSFRSLPMFLMNTILYLQNVSSKNISIRHIFYGMLDVSSELGYTPVVELNSILEINDWIIGAYSFKEYGNAYKIADLVDNASVKTKLTKFSELMNLNHLASIENQRQDLASIKNIEYGSALPGMIINPIVSKFIKEFSPTGWHCDFQFKLAQWHRQHKNYISSFVVFAESIITYVCEINEKTKSKWDDYDCRLNIKDVIKDGVEDNGIYCPEDVSLIFREINPIRNSLAHSIKRDNDYRNMIKALDVNMSAFEKILKNKKVYEKPIC